MTSTRHERNRVRQDVRVASDKAGLGIERSCYALNQYSYQGYSTLTAEKLLFLSALRRVKKPCTSRNSNMDAIQESCLGTEAFRHKPYSWSMAHCRLSSSAFCCVLRELDVFTPGISR